jgi:MFS family permease
MFFVKQVKFIFIISLFHQIVIQGSRPIIALLANDLGASVLEIGFIAATFALFPLFLAVRAGSWIDRWGFFSPIVIGSAGVTIALFLPFLYSAMITLFLSQIFAGISQIFVNISLQNALGMNVPKEKRDQIFGWFSFAVSGGQFLGPVIIGYSAEQYGLISAFLISGYLSLVPVIVGLMLYQQKKKAAPPLSPVPGKQTEKQPDEADQKLKMREIIRIKGMHQAILASMLVQFTKDVLLTYFPLYAVARGMSETEIGFILGLQGLSSMFIRIMQGSLLKRFPRRKVLLVSLLSGGLAFGLFTLFPYLGYLSLLAVITGLGLGLAQPLSIVMVVNLSPSGQSGQVLGIRIAGNRLAQIVSPLLFGAIAQVSGIAFVFWACSAILLAGAVYSTWKN